ncbi:Gluconate transporter [Alkaliphilus metalliredigens QYMF]|uniref:Gluconate transporter n=1 Tax=Alkaliphilus metalliredigens (strain QYMF) TaxID=293826 RepID=A6TKL0_ALKMQ|nr:SLC13 family permease [Alkaliphilus metalliredigens]ABR46728.1 Gluconate transporter [Alkaliphilus metalliredigens QYMF]
MLPSTFLLILIGAVVFLMFFILKLKMNPVLAILLVTIPLAILLGNSPAEAIEAINQGFGATLTSIGIVIILGSIMAVIVQDTGAAIPIANFFVKLVRGKNVELGPALAGYILSIPVFGDITTLLMAPIASTLAQKHKISMAKMAVFICVGLNITHALVPPTPGILAVTLQMGADLGRVILFGSVIGIIGFFILYFLLRDWSGKEMIQPIKEYLELPEELAGKQEQAATGEGVLDNLPSTFHSFLPLFLPVILITVASFMKVSFDPQSTAYTIITFLGDRVIALLIGVAAAMTLAIGRMEKVKAIARKNDSRLREDCSLLECIFGSWVTRALQMAVLPLLITGMGGAFGRVLAAAPAAGGLAETIAASGIPALAIPWVITMAMMACLGSMTMAQLTSAALVLPILPSLGISPLAAVLAIGAGAIGPNHVNNSGFWVFSGFYNLNPKQALKYITFPSVVMSIILFAIVFVLNSIGLLG